jgi:hypothetical protein
MSKSVKINSNKGKSTAQHEFHAQQVEERERERVTSGPWELLNLIDFHQHPISKFRNVLFLTSKIYEKI